MKKTFLFLIALVINTTTNAQTAGTIDPNFGTAGTATSTAQKNSWPYSIDFEAYSGEIATAGEYQRATGVTVGYIARFDFYGKPVASFGTNGILEISDLSTTSQGVSEVLFTANSGFIVRGTYKNASNATIRFFRKYLANGTLDTSFGNAGTLTGLYGEIQGNYIYSIKNNSVTKHQYLNRYLLADGSLDTTFNSSEFPFLTTDSQFYGSQYRHINFQSDGKIVLCGYKTISTIRYPFIARYDSLGNVDTTFGSNGYYTGTTAGDVWQTKTQSNGKIVFINSSYAINGPTNVLGRLNVNGTLDTTYGTAGYFIYTFSFAGNYVDKMLMQSDDKVLLCGSMVTDATGASSVFSARVTNTGIYDFGRLDLQSPYSENWSMVKPNDSYLLTFGSISNASSTLYTPSIQRIYLKAPVVSLIGDAYPNGNFTNDLNMSTVDGTTYTLNNINLTAGGAVKFRLDHDWKINWGTAATNPFPTGSGGMGVSDIAIPTTGNYNITFNIANGAYSFTSTLGTKEQSLSKISLYPNPTTSKITLQTPNESVIDKIIITDVTGKTVLEQIKNTNQIDVQNLSKGVYFLKVFSGKEQFQDMFIKE